MIKALIQHEYIAIIYASKNRAPKYIKQKLTGVKGKIDNPTTIFENFKTQSQ